MIEYQLYFSLEHLVSAPLKGHSSINTSLAEKLHNYVLILTPKIIFLKSQYFAP